MKKKTGKMNFIIPLIIYPFDVMLSFGETDKEVAKNLKKYDIAQDEIDHSVFDGETIQGKAIMFTGCQTMIRMRNFPTEIKDLSYLQHEIFHAVGFIMEQIGMVLKVGISDESYAYLIQYITLETYRNLNINLKAKPL